MNMNLSGERLILSWQWQWLYLPSFIQSLQCLNTCRNKMINDVLLLFTIFISDKKIKTGIFLHLELWFFRIFYWVYMIYRLYTLFLHFLICIFAQKYSSWQLFSGFNLGVKWLWQRLLFKFTALRLMIDIQGNLAIARFSVSEL